MHPRDRGLRASGSDADRRARARHSRGTALGASLLGAIVTFLYFRYVDVGSSSPRPGLGELAFSAVAFALLGTTGLYWSRRWLRPLTRHTSAGALPPDDRVRRRAVLLPYAVALVTFVGWALAGIV